MDTHSAASPSIPVVFSTDATYLPYVCVALQSLAAHASARRRYEILILHADIKAELQAVVARIAAPFKHCSVRFIDVSQTAKQLHLETFTRLQYLHTPAYYRLLAPLILEGYEKIVYLDCDLVVLADVADLFATELGTHTLAAVPDRGVAAHWQRSQAFVDYMRQLGMRDIKHYFNSGVLLMNLKQIRADNLIARWMEIARRNDRYFHDQNVLNVACEGRALFLDGAWNVQCYDKDAATRTRRILHYCGKRKPWQSVAVLYGKDWWRAARATFGGENPLFNVAATLAQIKTAYQRVRWRLLAQKIRYKLSLGKTRARQKEAYRILEDAL